MSELRKPDPVKLVCSVFASDRETLIDALRVLSDLYGRADYLSEYLAFDATDYYAREMGPSLVRRFVSYEDLIEPDALPSIKKAVNEVERRFSEGGNRRVNIDPGCVSGGHLVLATGKSGAHRPYLRDGVYADLTLIFGNEAFRSLEWTYPDYADGKVRAIFTLIRKKYLLQLRDRQASGAEK
ncbi:MAG TPA: DUF4416 family protein [Syntrophales bacterium]|nr:DUF4416 family protein [Syntrophales bacterium]HOX94133.1 DUF4416 family protein [Syntrophales bacterium]HPI57363.1 DUF4416 family protein [Syntrophales bacterium]HPN25427.1 DUF4416 family protein [Syntrophales bacterium]HQM29909.1 DUF4416 family protein [Syntrophales bacterium]